MTNEASRIFGNPVIIVDAGHKLLAMCQAPIPSRPDIEQQRNLSYILDSNIESMKKSNLYELTRMALIPYYSRDPETNDYLDNSFCVRTWYRIRAGQCYGAGSQIYRY
ncbi:hypothetical protein [Paenibacillus sp. CH40]|uniref:hypothetical protein n=1 Tax=Paenibacillus sp. CH40 TaxID=2962045 RepID=UPI0020B8BB09|nr:hypothetical protein [Paenibacillus sp. CH40]MCP3794042.1 hypothetical protein [Paenibacillus sp. CH40]